MPDNVLDGVMEIEAKAARTVDEAKAQARQVREKVKADLGALGQQLDAEAEQQAADYAQGIEARKEAALAELDRQLDAVLAAIGTAKAERMSPLAEEVLRRLEQ